MCVACENIIEVNVRTFDPTRTISLRNLFVRDSRRRFNELKSIIRKAIVDNDVFGLNPHPATFQELYTPGNEAFIFRSNAQKVDDFMQWLHTQVERGLLEISRVPQVGSSVNPIWSDIYITDSYKRGVMRARYEMIKAGFEVPSIDSTGGINIAINTPFHIDRLGILYTRVYGDLKGITDAMEGQISRVLSQGIADGDNPRVLDRKLVAVIDGQNAGTLGITDSLGRFIPAQRRAEILARTEIIRAHHQATIQEYKNWGVQGVTVKAEWMTAGDNRVCSQCQAMEGEIFTLEDIMNKIPLHPQCRCVALPFKEYA